MLREGETGFGRLQAILLRVLERELVPDADDASAAVEAPRPGVVRALPRARSARRTRHTPKAA